MGGDSEHLPVEMGSHQGSALHLFLFVLVMDKLIRHILHEVSWCLLFVNDIVLIEETQAELTIDWRC